MATAKLTWENLNFPAKNDIVPVYGGFARALTKEMGVVTESSKYPAAPFLFFAPYDNEVAKYWGELLFPQKEPVYLSVLTGAWGEEAILESPLASIGTAAVPQRALFSAEWDRLKLELMRLGSLGQNWDGEDAEAVSPTSVRTARTLLDLAQEASARAPYRQSPPPTLFASVEGGIAIKWHLGPRELKCVALGDKVEVIRWSSSERFESDGFWEVPAHEVAEHFKWLLQ